MPQIAKLYIRDEHDEPVGTLVLDMEKIVSMYTAIMTHRFEESAQNQDLDKSKAGKPRMVRKISDTLAWYTDDNGEYWLQERKGE